MSSPLDPQPSVWSRAAMTPPHTLVVIVVALAALALFLGVLFGRNADMYGWIYLHRSVRDICLALWATLLPAWFHIEEVVWMPSRGSQRSAFRAGQRKARIAWIVAGFVLLGVVLGTPGPAPPPAPAPAAATRIPAPPQPGAVRR